MIIPFLILLILYSLENPSYMKKKIDLLQDISFSFFCFFIFSVSAVVERTGHEIVKSVLFIELHDIIHSEPFNVTKDLIWLLFSFHC